MNSSYRKPLFALSLISITAVAVVLVCMQMVNITNKVTQKSRAAATDALMDEAEEKLKEGMQELLNGICVEIYVEMVNEYGSEVQGMLGTGYKEEYTERCVDSLNAAFGDGSELIARLGSLLPAAEGAELQISNSSLPSFELVCDEAEGEIRQCTVSDVTVECLKRGRNEESRKMDISLSPPEADFADAQVSLNDYCLIGLKGIYITGDTSSIVGNIYAGTHKYEEGREEDMPYGERDPYGGINVLASGLTVHADTIATEGDINIKGSFAVMGSDERKVSVFANTLNAIDSFPDRTEYTVNGKEFLRDGSTAFTDQERYDEITALMNETGGRISVIGTSYASREDSTYEGTVDKIVSDEDVTIEDNYTGVVITTGNIYVEEGVNVEGLLIAGDRIYIKGNDNIVSGSEVISTLLDEEEELKNGSNYPEGGLAGDYINSL